jgi:hypothetical protein
LIKRATAVLFAVVFAASLASCAEPKPTPASTTGSSASDTEPGPTTQSTGESSGVSSTASAESPSSATRTTARPASTKTTVKKTTRIPPTSAPTTSNAIKAAAFTFSQTFPLEITAYGARFQILDAAISGVKMDADGGCTFNFSCSAKRLEDGIAGKKTCAVRVKWFNENGEQVKATGPAIGSLGVGETGRCNTVMGMKASEMQGSPNSRFTVSLEGYGEAG